RLDRADPGRQPDRDAMIPQPALQPRAVELAQGDQRQLQLESRPVAEEAVEEDLAGMPDVHLVETLVQGRDQDGSPEQVDGSEALAVAQEPIGERLAGAVLTVPGQASQAIGHAQLVAQTQESRRQEAAGQMERSRREAGPEPRDSSFGTEE